jgi:hypothetical protein
MDSNFNPCNPMTPKKDATDIFNSFASDGIEKYKKGVQEHGGGLWTGGCSWYADQLHDELIDSASYLHHLRVRLRSIATLATMMKEGDVEMNQAAVILEELAGVHPPHSEKK